MSGIQCPYNALELKTSLFAVSNKIEAYDKQHGEGASGNKLEELFAALTKDDEDPKTGKEQIAAFHGITVEQLINSPNYQTLQNEYGTAKLDKIRATLGAEFGLDDRQTWAFVLAEQIENMTPDQIMRGFG